MTTTPTPLDPLAVLRGLASLRRLTGAYPAGHPMIAQKLKEVGDLVDETAARGEDALVDVRAAVLDRRGELVARGEDLLVHGRAARRRSCLGEQSR